MAEKKKVQRTDWKKEFVLLQEDRNNFIDKWQRVQKTLEEAEQEIKGQSKLVVRLEARASKVGEQLDAMQTIVELMTSAPAHSIAGGGVEGYGRDVLLGMLLERLRNIERPVPF
jgi:hypothetical protein